MDRLITMVWFTPSNREPEANGNSTRVSVCQGVAPWATAASTAALGTS